ncbi:MarR family transcriptional regulator [Pseudonocardiaceae bacterium YIM PH 21723]|nr:MarR family transcriptional regulator [Pseudonocardiaceae bacterium YIM PH 21723]
MPGGRLTTEDRQHIAAGLADGLGYAEIGRRLERPASTVMREVTRNGGPEGYRADRAQTATRHRARRRKREQPQVAPVEGPQAVQEFAEFFTTLLIGQGLPRMSARVLASLAITDSGTLTAADLAARLRISHASVSQAVGFLEHQGLLKRERVPGVRHERYVVDEDVWLRSLRATVEMNDELMAASTRGMEVLGAETPAGVRFQTYTRLLHLVSESLRDAMRQWERER